MNLKLAISYLQMNYELTVNEQVNKTRIQIVQVD
jgi:hypothetical protein